MRVVLSNCTAPLPRSSSFPPTPPNKSIAKLGTATIGDDWGKKIFVGALSAVLSFNFILSSPFSLALESPYRELQLPSPPSAENCTEDEEENQEEINGPQLVTNEGIVEEAWQIVNDGFLDTGRHRWSSESWKQKREDILSTSIQSRSKAHDMIKRMLASLGDPYTRFLSPAEFS